MSTVDDVPAAMCSFFDHLCGPFFAAFRILGVCPYTRNSNGVFHKRIVSASSVYTLFSGAAFGYATFVAIKTLSGQPPPIAMSNFNHILLKFGYATLIAPSAIVPVIMWFETTKLQAYLHEWQLFQDNYNRVVGKSNSIAMIAIVKKRVNRIYRSILVFLSITIVAISWSSWTISDVYVLFCTIRSVSIMVFIVGFWFVGAIAIEATIDGYKKKLQTDLDGRHSFGFGARSIEDYRLLWLQLSRLVHGVGDYMSATVTFCIFHTTVLVVLSVYAVAVWGATLVRLRRYEALASASVALVCNATSLYVYCDCGYSQTRKCVDSVILLILKLKSSARWTTSNYIQITLFLNAVNQYQPNVSVIGFYEINRGLLGSILSLLLTYLIVLIQLNSSFTIPSTVEHNNNNTMMA